MLLTIIIFILILGLLVFVHELGHFLLAKKAGAKVEEFGFGFPPRIFSKKIKGTIYSFNLIPLGGFVKIYGEDGQGKKNPASFASKTIWQRFKILIAGVLMNLILAIALLSVGYMIGLPTIIENSASFKGPTKVQIIEIAPGSPAELSELQVGDTIGQIIGPNGQKIKINNVSEMQSLIASQKGNEITIFITRGGEELEFKVLAREEHAADQGPLGVALVDIGLISYPWYQALAKGTKAFANIFVLILATFFEIIKSIFAQGKMIGEIYGPVGIFGLTGQAAQMGLAYLLQFAALLSINLAIINAFPFPGLDGGRIFFLLVEKIKGSPVNQNVEKWVHMVGFVLLILLVMTITFKDIMRLF